MSAIFNFQSLLSVILLLICTCAYLRSFFPSIMDRNKTGSFAQFNEPDHMKLTSEHNEDSFYGFKVANKFQQNPFNATLDDYDNSRTRPILGHLLEMC